MNIELPCCKGCKQHYFFDCPCPGCLIPDQYSIAKAEGNENEFLREIKLVHNNVSWSEIE